MANTIKVTDKLAAIAIDVFMAKSYVAANSVRSDEDEFGGSTKIGDTLRKRVPARYQLQTGNDRSNPQAIEQQTKTLSLNQNKFVALNLTAQELAVFTGTDAKAQRELIEQPVANLARYVDSYCFGLMALQAANQISIATAGTVSYKDIANMSAQMGTQLAPSERILAASPLDLASIQGSMSTLLNPTKAVSDAFDSGLAGSGLGFGSWHESVSVGTQGCLTVSGTASATVTAEGTITIPTAATILQGQAFTIAGVYKIDPQTLTGIPSLYTFVAAAASTGTSVQITNPIYTIAGSITLANVSALPISGAVLTNVGVAGDSGKNAYNLIGWTKKAFSLACMDLPTDLPGAEASKVTDNGISIRVTRQAQTRANAVDTICDLQFGALVLRPEWIARMTGVAA